MIATVPDAEGAAQPDMFDKVKCVGKSKSGSKGLLRPSAKKVTIILVCKVAVDPGSKANETGIKKAGSGSKDPPPISSEKNSVDPGSKENNVVAGQEDAGLEDKPNPSDKEGLKDKVAVKQPPNTCGKM